MIDAEQYREERAQSAEVVLVIGELYSMEGQRFNPTQEDDMMEYDRGEGDGIYMGEFYTCMYLGPALDPCKKFTKELHPGEESHTFLCKGKLYHVYGDNLSTQCIKRISGQNDS